MKYYLSDDAECVSTLDVYKNKLKCEEADKFILREQKRDIGGDMWCWVFGIFIIRGEGDCGKTCKCYDPRNGKSGRCRNLENGFVDTGRIFELNKDGLKEVNK